MIPSKFRVMTINLRHETPERADSTSTQRLSALAQLIETFRPAVIGTQEGEQAQIESLGEMLPGYTLVSEHRKWIEGLSYPAVFVHGSEVEVTDARDVWLSETPRVRGSSSWGAAPTPATIVELSHLPSRRNLLFACAQLERSAPKARFEQGATLLAQLMKGNTERLPMILVGSFHEEVDGSIYKLLTGRRVVKGMTGNFVDAWRRLGRSELDASTVHGAGEGKGERVDWIMFDSSVEIQEVTRLPEGANGSWPSDHFPVGAELLI